VFLTITADRLCVEVVASKTICKKIITPRNLILLTLSILIPSIFYSDIILQISLRVLVLNMIVLSIFKDSLLALNHIESLFNSMFIISIKSKSFLVLFGKMLVPSAKSLNLSKLKQFFMSST